MRRTVTKCKRTFNFLVKRQHLGKKMARGTFFKTESCLLRVQPLVDRHLGWIDLRSKSAEKIGEKSLKNWLYLPSLLKKHEGQKVLLSSSILPFKSRVMIQKLQKQNVICCKEIFFMRDFFRYYWGKVELRKIEGANYVRQRWGIKKMSAAGRRRRTKPPTRQILMFCLNQIRVEVLDLNLFQVHFRSFSGFLRLLNRWVALSRVGTSQDVPSSFRGGYIDEYFTV